MSAFAFLTRCQVVLPSLVLVPGFENPRPRRALSTLPRGCLLHMGPPTPLSSWSLWRWGTKMAPIDRPPWCALPDTLRGSAVPSSGPWPSSSSPQLYFLFCDTGFI